MSIAIQNVSTVTAKNAARGMRLLVLSPVLPYPPTNGVKMRIFSALRALAGLGHELHLVACDTKSDLHTRTLLEICREVTLIEHKTASLSGRGQYLHRLAALPRPLPYGSLCNYSRQVIKTVDHLLRAKHFDAVVAETLDSFVNLPQIKRTPVILDNHNVEHLILRRFLDLERHIVKRSYGWLELQKLRMLEKRACSQSDLVLVCSRHDKSVIERMSPGTSVCVVPNVVDSEVYKPVVGKEDSRTVLYMGGMDWYPNRDAVEFFVRSILPKIRQQMSDVRFVIAGRNPASNFRRRLESVPGVHFTGTVEDMRPQIGSGTVCVVPLRIGSGTRFKILEAAAMGKAIVSTSIGAEGLDLVHGKEILLADAPQDFADAILAVLANPDLRQSLGSAARSRVQRQYGLPALQHSIRQALSQLSDTETLLESCHQHP